MNHYSSDNAICDRTSEMESLDCVETPSGQIEFFDASLGATHSCFHSSVDFSVYCVGSNSELQLGSSDETVNEFVIDEPMLSVTAEGYHTCMLTQARKVKGMG